MKSNKYAVIGVLILGIGETREKGAKAGHCCVNTDQLKQRE
jgi:hypothetical protein